MMKMGAGCNMVYGASSRSLDPEHDFLQCSWWLLKVSLCHSETFKL